MSKTVDPEVDRYGGKSPGLYWRDQLDHAEKAFSTWVDKGTKIVERFRDERDAVERLRSKFNILWSNYQVLYPSLYGRKAKPEVSRRYSDADPVSRCASEMLERCLDYEVEQFQDFDESMSGCVEDRLLCGRGQSWVRLQSSIQIGSSEDAEETITEARAITEYVYWKDFRHSPARRWDEVWWAARAVYLTREEGVDRFGHVFSNVPLSDYREDNSKKPKDRAEEVSFSRKAKIWEIWDKRTRTVCWLAESYPQLLDEQPDPLGLDGFFPCPKPLYATTTTGSLVPVPDYLEYQDQARELDAITARIDDLVEAVRVAGVYNSEYKELSRLLQTKGNKLVPVSNWGNLSEKGGLKGAVDLLDISVIVTALSALYNAREAVKQVIYEISGVSDIQRGSTKAEETLGAQQLKANFASLRLQTWQTDVARFASDLFRLKAEIIAKFYPHELLMQMSGINMTTDGQNGQLVTQALELLSNSRMMDFHIKVESDSLAQIDEAQEKKDADEAITSIGKFLEAMLPMGSQAPPLLPMIGEMLKFSVRHRHATRSLEASIEQAFAGFQQMASQPKGPTKEQMDAQMQQQADQMRIAADTKAAQMKEQFASQAQVTKLQAEGQLEQMKMRMQAEAAQLQAQMDAAIAAKEQEIERLKIGTEQETKIRIAEMENATKLQIAEMTAQGTAAKDDLERWKAELDAKVAVETAKMGQDTSLRTAEMSAKSSEKTAETTARVQAESKKSESSGGTSAGALLDKMTIQPPKVEVAAPVVHVHVPEAKTKKRTRKISVVRDASGKMQGANIEDDGD